MEALTARGTPFSTSNLPVADFEIGGPSPVLVERKTPSDLLASLADQRFRQQKERLKLRAQEGAKVVFLLEGKPFLTPSSLEPRLRAAFYSISLLPWCGLMVTAANVCKRLTTR